MEAFGLIDKLYEYSLANDWVFLNGDNFYANIDADTEMKADQLVLWVEINASPAYGIGNRLNQINYTGLIALGYHKDLDETESSLDESFNQKYNRRLKDLLQTLSDAVSNVSCANNLQIISANMVYDINKFDTNIDFVAGTFNIEQSTFGA